MTKEKSSKTGFIPDDQIQLIYMQSRSIHSGIYKWFALYIQQIRDSLPHTVNNSILTIIEESNYEHLPLNNKINRTSFKSNIDKIISKYSSLLTVEHLLNYSSNIQSQSFKNSISNKDNNDSFIDPFADAYVFESFEIKSELPISNSSEYTSLINYNQPLLIQSQSISTKDLNGNKFSSISSTRLHEKDLEDSQTDFSNSILPGSLSSILDTFVSSDSPQLEELDLTYMEDSNKNDYFFPTNPIDLLRLISNLEKALAKTLLNLSQDLNIELLRVGIINSFIPTNIFEAVNSGQLDTPYAPCNILKLNLPDSVNLIDNSIPICCLNIKSSDLEFDSFKLRKCKTKFNEYKKQLASLSTKYHYWRNRMIIDNIGPDILKSSSKNSNHF